MQTVSCRATRRDRTRVSRLIEDVFSRIKLMNFHSVRSAARCVKYVLLMSMTRVEGAGWGVENWTKFELSYKN